MFDPLCPAVPCPDLTHPDPPPLYPGQDLKRTIIDDGLTVLVNYVIIPHSGWNRGSTHSEPVMDVFWSTVFRNATGVLR